MNSYTNREPVDREDKKYLVVIEDDRSDLDLKAEGSEANREGPKLDIYFAFNAMVSSNN